MIELIDKGIVERWGQADDMIPLQVCIAEDGSIVMRTASTTKFEIMDLSNPGVNACWTDVACFKVRALRPGETYTLKLS